MPGHLIRVSGEATRSVPLTEPLHGLLVSRRRADADAALVLHDAEGGQLKATDISRLVLFAAYDAALDRPEEISPAALRYTYLCSLVRQGIRASDIADVMGRVSQRELIACIQLHAPRERRPLELIDRVLPPLRELAGVRAGEISCAIRGLLTVACGIPARIQLSAAIAAAVVFLAQPSSAANLFLPVSLTFVVTVCLDEVEYSIACRSRGSLEVQHRTRTDLARQLY